MENLDEQQNGTATRPVFLTVLCILSFIAAGIGVLGILALIALVGVASSVSNEFGEAMSAASTTSGGGLLYANIAVSILALIVSLIGVIKMWKLQKSGFMLYTIATIASLVMGIVYSGIALSIPSIVISGAFIVMYGLNVKHLK
jgi:hypothetical protein